MDLLFISKILKLKNYRTNQKLGKGNNMNRESENKQTRANYPRRSFLKNSLSAASGFTLIPFKNIFAGNKVWSEEAGSLKNASVVPSEKVNIACIGIGHRGGQIIKDLYNTGLVNIFCKFIAKIRN